MEENLKITHVKNMNKFNFSSTLNIPVDSNVNIKNILDVNTYLFDVKVECGNSKAILSGKIGVKVLYLDTDNLTNTISDKQNFTETYLDNSITSETYLNMCNHSISNTILSTDGVLKINCEISVTPFAYLNLSMKNNFQTNDLLITKKSEITTNSISKIINTHFEHISNLETSDKISKILCNNCYFTPEHVSAQDGYAVVEGKMSAYILYETIQNEEILIKEINDINSIKYDIEIDGLTKNDCLDVSFMIDKSYDDISTETEDNQNFISIKNKICVQGVILKTISLDLIDDMFSTDNLIESTYTKRDFNKNIIQQYVSETISNELSFENSEPAIDEVISNLNIIPEITNSYIKNNNLIFEGIVSSNLTYIDENKEIKNKQIQVPFVINSKVNAENLDFIHQDISHFSSKIKIKRGTIIEIEYGLFINFSNYEKETREIIDSFSIGKPIDNTKYDFQIFIAKTGETLWDLCKRIKISPEEIHNYNKNLPMVMQGGEKVIIKR